jgi:hypothetical protein
MAEAFVNSFAKGTESLLAQQDRQLDSRKEFPPTLPAPLIEETPPQYRKGKCRAMTGLEIAEEREEMLHSNVDEMRGLLLHLRRKKKRDRKSRAYGQLPELLPELLIHSSSSSLASCRTWMLIVIVVVMMN